jgi:hypothetical protein
MVMMRKVALRSATAGFVDCAVLAFVSYEMETRELHLMLHNNASTFPQLLVQILIVCLGVSAAIFFCGKEVMTVSVSTRRKAKLSVIIALLGFFGLGFVLAGLLLPSR